MAEVGKLYGKVFTSLFNKEIDYVTDTIKGMICTSSYIPDQDVHQYASEVLAFVGAEITGAAAVGYTAGGVEITGKTITYDAVNNKTILDAADFEVTNATITGARYVVLFSEYIDNTDPLNPVVDYTKSPLIGYIDLGSDRNITTGTFKLVWSANGIFSFTVA